jgi:hypothetical protein
VLSAVLLVQGSAVRAQWGYPGGFGGWGWGGWGGGSTPQGDMAMGLGMFAMGAGMYNEKTAVADSINTDTIMRWNEYMYESAVNAGRIQRARQAKRRENVIETADATQKRLRENPDQRDIFRGDALNVALEEISNPRVYMKALSNAKIKIGGDTIRDIPFQYAAAAITTSLDQVMRGTPPAALLTDDFAEDRAEFRKLRALIREDIEEGITPDRATVQKAIAVVNAAEAKLETLVPRNSRDRVAADRFLKSVHGILVMLDTPAMNVILAGVENRPDATLGELLNFMNAFNLRFGVADSPRQRMIYGDLFPKLAALRTQVAAGLAPEPPKSTASGDAPGNFFSGMDYADLRKKAPPPAAPAPAAKP